MKKVLLGLFTILLATFGFGGISMADTTVTHHTENVVPGTYTLNGNTGFTAGTITVTNGTTTITILDRNLGATTAGTGCENRARNQNTCAQGDSTYGYHFQWGNNYGFPSVGVLPNTQKSTTQVESGSITIPYSSSVFISVSDWNWLNDDIFNLWGGSKDDSIDVNNDAWKVTNATERKGPCPDGFHVPSIGELRKLSSMFNNDGATMYNKLLIPFAGYRASNDAASWNVGHHAFLLSSTPYSTNMAKYLQIHIDGSNGSTISYDSYSDNYRANAYSVRCFYNDYTEYGVSAPTEITEINISGIVDPVAGATATTGGLTITSTPTNAIDINTDSSFLPQYPHWRAYNATASLPGSTPGYACKLYNNADETRCRPTFLNGASAPTYYYLRIIYSLKDGYVMSDDYTVTANNSYGEILTGSGTDGYGNPNDSYYVRIKYLPTDIPNASTEISTINITGPESVTDGADWLHDWTISTTDNTYTKSNYLPVEWNGTAWVDGTHESVPAGYTVGFKVTLTPNEGYVFAENPVINYNGTAWTNSGHTFLSGNILYIDLGTVPTSSPTSTIYTITLGIVSNGTITASTGAATSGTEITLTATPASNYNFGSWTVKDADNNSITVTDNKFAMPASNVTVTATFTAKSTGGGGGGKTVKKDTTNTDTDKTTEKEDTDNDVPLAIENNSDTPIYEEGNQSEILSNGYTREFNNAYRFGLKYGITTMDDINKADMHGPLTRIAMDKMLVNYAINVLHMVPDTTREVPNFPDVDQKLNEEYGNAVTLGYQLGIMGINIEEFRPFDEVHRGDLGTSLGRMLFGLEDGEGLYYEPHLKKLKEKGIITNDDPNLQELRGYVMLMLMRSAM